MTAQSNNIPATLAILTRNSGPTLRRALQSAREFSDIIICDGGSTDDTLAIAGEYGAKILQQDKAFLDAEGRLFDYGGARNQCLDASTEEWFFFLDSDEYCGADLIEAIRSVVARGVSGAYWINRKYVMKGVVIDQATTYPNRQMRLFAKTSARRFIKKVHERIELQEGVQPRVLPGTMYVPLDMELLELRTKWEYQIAVEVARVGELSLWRYATAIAGFLKVSCLYVLRHLRILLISSGTRMPFLFEIERHRLHWRTVRAFWPNVRLPWRKATRRRNR